MTTKIEKIDVILKEVIDEKKHSKSRFATSPYGSQGKKYLYLYRIKKNNGGM